MEPVGRDLLGHNYARDLKTNLGPIIIQPLTELSGLWYVTIITMINSYMSTSLRAASRTGDMPI